MNRLYTVFLLLPLLFFTACQDDLSNKNWVLTEIAGATYPLSGKVHMQIYKNNEETYVAGSGGCNRFNGKFTVKGETLSVGPLIATRMACGSMREEHAFFEAMNRVDGYRLDKGELLLLRGDTPLLRFKSMPLSDAPGDGAR